MTMNTLPRMVALAAATGALAGMTPAGAGWRNAK